MEFSYCKAHIQNKEITILQPVHMPQNLWFAEPVIDSHSILANANGFTFLRDLFLITAQNSQPHVMFYVPALELNERTPAMVTEKVKKFFTVGEFDLDLILTNDSHLHIGPKEIKEAIQTHHNANKDITSIEPDPVIWSEYVDQSECSKIADSFPIKVYAKTLAISAEREVLLQMAYLADRFTNMKDDAKYNFHMNSHPDQAGTSEMNGLNFLYYFSP